MPSQLLDGCIPYNTEPVSAILQRTSINSLIDRDLLNQGNEGETMSISDLLGLNSPRGLLGNSFGPSQGLCTPPATPTNYQLSFEDTKLQNGSLNFANAASPAKTLQRNMSSSAPCKSQIPPNFFPSRNLRSTSLSDSCGSSSPIVNMDSLLLSNNTRSNSPADSEASAASIPDVNQNLTEMFNSLTLSDALTRNYFGNLNELELPNLQNLQALQAFKYLQQPPALLSTLLHSACSHNANQQILDKWNNNALGLMSLAGQVQENLQLDRAARLHRSTASVYDATCTWSGVLPPRTAKATGFSSKVFLGGVPWDISEQLLIQTFKQFGSIRVEWPGKEKPASQPKGYVYIIFESEKSVKALLQACTTDYSDYSNSGNWYFKIPSKRMKSSPKEVQVIPWFLNDSNYTKSTSQKLDPSKTVFVGALHGMLNAEGLAKIMNDLFDGVVYAGIDTDKYKYPIGSGRITFNNSRSYAKAVAAEFIEIKTSKFTKKVQVNPYLEDSLCSVCGVQQGPYFCKEVVCYRYFCRTCWNWQHTQDLRHHKPMWRNSKNSTVLGSANAPLN